MNPETIETIITAALLGIPGVFAVAFLTALARKGY